MKKLFYLMLATVTIAGCTEDNDELDNAKDLYQAAIENNDMVTAKVALNQLILFDSTNLDYKDSLAMLYMSSGNYKAGTKLGAEVYEAGKANDKMKEALALSYQQLNRIDKAMDLFEELWKETGKYRYQYQKLVIFYNTRDLVSFDTLSTQLLTTIENDTIAAASVVELTGPVTGQPQDVPLKAAVYFIIGQHAFDNEQNVQKSIEYLSKSIEEFNEFELARYAWQNIEQMVMASRR